MFESIEDEMKKSAGPEPLRNRILEYVIVAFVTVTILAIVYIAIVYSG